MIHILRLIVGIVIMYLLASSLLVLNYVAEENMDSLPIYIKIPGVLCWIIVLSIPIILLVYILGAAFLG